MRRWTLLAGLVAALTLPAAAAADVDPASDILLLQDVFVPQSPPPDQGDVATIRAMLREAKKQGLPLKVAIIGAASDLGGIPQLFGKPQPYARFLGTELTGATGQRQQPLLVVMPAGFGTFQLTPKATAALRGVQIGQGGNPDLVKAAIAAIPKVAAAEGHPIKTPSGGGGGGSSSAPIAVFVLPVLLLVAIGLILRQRGRRES
jgi:hypothetical protein